MQRMTDLWLLLKEYTIVIIQGKSERERKNGQDWRGNPWVYGKVSWKIKILKNLFLSTISLRYWNLDCNTQNWSRACYNSLHNKQDPGKHKEKLTEQRNTNCRDGWGRMCLYEHTLPSLMQWLSTLAKHGNHLLKTLILCSSPKECDFFWSVAWAPEIFELFQMFQTASKVENYHRRYLS